MKIDIAAFDGCDELDVIGPYEVFVNARANGADVDPAIVSLHDQVAVLGANGASLIVQEQWGARSPDMILVPGGGWGNKAPQGTWAEVQAGKLTQALVEAHGSGTTIIGVCTGAMVVASAGLLDGRPARSHAAALTGLQELGATVVEARVVDDGDVMTSGGVTAAIDLALWIVERDFGAAIADAVVTEIEYERQGSIWTREGAREAATSRA